MRDERFSRDLKQGARFESEENNDDYDDDDNNNDDNDEVNAL